jgi:hypothetical protein
LVIFARYNDGVIADVLQLVENYMPVNSCGEGEKKQPSDHRNRVDITPVSGDSNSTLIHEKFLKAHCLAQHILHMHLGAHSSCNGKPHAVMNISWDQAFPESQAIAPALNYPFSDLKKSMKFGLKSQRYLDYTGGDERYIPAYRCYCKNPQDRDLFALSRVIWFPENAYYAQVKGSHAEFWNRALKQCASSNSSIFTTAQIYQIDSAIQAQLTGSNTPDVSTKVMFDLLNTQLGVPAAQTDALSFSATLMIAHDSYQQAFSFSGSYEDRVGLDLMKGELIDTLIQYACRKAQHFTNDPVKKLCAEELLTLVKSSTNDYSGSDTTEADYDSNTDDQGSKNLQLEVIGKRKKIISIALATFKKHRWWSGLRNTWLRKFTPIDWVFSKIFSVSTRAYSESEDYLFKAAQLIDPDFFMTLKNNQTNKNNVSRFNYEFFKSFSKKKEICSDDFSTFVFSKTKP